MAWLAAIAIAVLAVAAPSWASVSTIDPPSGTVTQGSATTATITLTSALSCVVGVADDPSITVLITDPIGGCSVGTAPWSAVMTVQTSTLTSIGAHVITIREVSVLGLEISTVDWDLNVVEAAPATTTTTTTAPPTTTTSTTTTLPGSSTTTTTTPPAGSTTTTTTTVPVTGSTTTTTTLPPTGSTTTTTTTTVPSTGGTTTTTTVPPLGPTTTTTTTLPGSGGSGPGGPTTPSVTTTPDDSDLLNQDGSVQAAGGDDTAQLPGASFSTAARNALLPILPPLLVDGILSPLVLAEYVLRAMLDSGAALIVPTIALLLACAFLVWRTRKRRDAAGTTDAGRSFLPDGLRPRAGALTSDPGPAQSESRT